MADTFTPNYNLTKPQVGGDPDTWGDLLNANFDTIDTQMKANYDLANAALPKAGGALTGALSITTTGSTGALVITDTGANGANIKLTGDGATTPSKYIRVKGGALEFANNGYSAILASLSDSGTFTITGDLVMANAGAISGPASIRLSASGPLLYQSDTTNHSFDIRTGPSTAYRFFKFAADGTFSALNGGGSFAGAVSANSFSSTTFAAGAGTVELCAATNNVYLRPRGPSNTTGQLTLNTSGVASAADFQATSDTRLKDEIRPLRRGIDALKLMPPREYVKYLDESKSGEGKEEIGFLAQEAQKVIPEAVTADDDGYLSLSYGQVTALLAAAVLEIDRRLAALENAHGRAE